MRLSLKNFAKSIMNLLELFSKIALPYLRALFSRVGVDLKKYRYNTNSKRCYVLGNGPSLKDSISEVLNEARDCDFVTVNHFSESEYFKVLKPSYHVLLDLYFWAENTHEDLVLKRIRFFDSLKEVDWKLTIFVPSTADIVFLRNSIKNDNIKIVPFKIVQIEDVKLGLARFFIKRKYFGPPACNVLLYAIYVALAAKYDEVHVFGADMSFHNDVEVDQKTNELQIKYTHFYGETEYQTMYHNPERVVPVKMYELMKLTASTFYGHELLSIFAKERGQAILNRSGFSIIDSYARSAPGKTK